MKESWKEETVEKRDFARALSFTKALDKRKGEKKKENDEEGVF